MTIDEQARDLEKILGIKIISWIEDDDGEVFFVADEGETK